MPLFAFGVNQRTAPLDFREKVSFPPENLSDVLRDVAGLDGVEEVAILSTCNRTDLYCGLEAEDGGRTVDWFREYHRLKSAEVERHFYAHRAESAVRHVMRVASGLDSMILGEPQILGQVKDAYRTAVDTGTVGQQLNQLFQQSFSVAKQVRTDTAIGNSPVSVAFAAVSLAKQIFGELNNYTALLIGAGDTIELAARHLKTCGLGRMVIANRTLEKAHQLAAEFDGYAIALNEIPAHLGEADIVVSSTGSPTPIVDLEMVRKAIGKRKRRPIFMVDIAVPRDVETAVGDLDDVYLYTVDDLENVIQENLRSRRDAAEQAEEIIDTEVSHFMSWLGQRDVVSTIRAYRGSADQVREEVLDRARQMLATGEPADTVLAFLAHTLTNKLLHPATVQLRQAGSDGREDLVNAARVLFALENTDPPEDNDPQ